MIIRKVALSILCFVICLLPLQSFAAGTVRLIVSLGPTNTENVFLLGAGGQVVGDTVYCMRPQAAESKPKVGTVMLASMEKIVALRPDLILATALTRGAQIRQLRDMGFKVVRFRQPRSFTEICRQFIRLGRLLGRTKRAEEIIRRSKAGVAALQKQLVGRKRPRVFLQVGAQPLYGAVSSSFTHDFITLGGGVNIIAGQKKSFTSLEKVIAANPAVIIIAIMGSESGIAAQEKRKWEGFKTIRAARDERVYTIAPNLVCSPTPVTFVNTLYRIAAMIHPGLKIKLGGAGP
jgi:iron complex transport system substrate-binding protein